MYRNIFEHVRERLILFAYKNNLMVEFEYFPMADLLNIMFQKGNVCKSIAWENLGEATVECVVETVTSEIKEFFKLDSEKDCGHIPSIKNVIFNDPATIIFWDDNTKTVVKAQDEWYDPEKGMAMAIAKKALGNQGNYCNVFKKWLPEEVEKTSMYDAIADAMATFGGINKYFYLKKEEENEITD